MQLHVENVLKEYAKQTDQYRNINFAELAPNIEKAMENDFKELLSVFGIDGRVKAAPNNIPHNAFIISKHKYRAMWLGECFVGFQAPFYNIMKELFNRNIRRMRFNISLSITKAEDENSIRDYYYFEFQFKYFAQPEGIDQNQQESILKIEN